MTDHRLIEKLLNLIDRKINNTNSDNLNPILIDTIIDFIQVYTDRTHHGKEEEILFKEIGKKKINHGDYIMMFELIEDNKLARSKVNELIQLNEDNKNNHTNDLNKIIEIFKWLISFYPNHIKKEDEIFFPNTEKYFTNEELDKMLNDFHEFDRNMIHEKYINVYNLLNK